MGQNFDPSCSTRPTWTGLVSTAGYLLEVTRTQNCLAKESRFEIFAAARRCQAHKAAINQREKSNFQVAANISRCLRLFIEGVSFFWPPANAVSDDGTDRRRLAARHITRQRITEAYRWQLITADAPFRSCWFSRAAFDAVPGQRILGPLKIHTIVLLLLDIGINQYSWTGGEVN